jgi:hypothetical protein
VFHSPHPAPPTLPTSSEIILTNQAHPSLSHNPTTTNPILKPQTPNIPRPKSSSLPGATAPTRLLSLLGLLLAHLLHFLDGHIIFLRLDALLRLRRQLGLPFALAGFGARHAVLLVRFDFLVARGVVCGVVVCVLDVAEAKCVSFRQVSTV